MNKTSEYDFSAIDRHIAWEQAKNQQILENRNSLLWVNWAKVFGFFLFGVGCFLLLLSIAYYIYIATFSDKSSIISYHNVNDKQLNTIISKIDEVEKRVGENDLSELQVKVGDLSTKIEDLSDTKSDSLTLSEIAKNEQLSDGNVNDFKPIEEQVITKTFTVFETIDNVVTGRTYSPSNTSLPFSQYCYKTEPLDENSDKTIRTELATKNENDEIIYYNLDDNLTTNCRFIDGVIK
jgi:hypothetical protein